MLKLYNVLVTVQFAKTKTILDIYDYGQNILDKIKLLENFNFSFSLIFLLVLTKCSLVEEELALVFNSIKVWDFPDIS